LPTYKQHKPAHKYIAVILATLIASLLNYYSVSFFSGSELIFGNMVAVAITLIYGLRAGLFCSFFAALATFVNWGHLLVILPFLIEIVVVNWALVNKKRPVFAGFLYWLSLGWIIVAIEFYFFSDYMQATKIAIVIKFIINGFLNIIFGHGIASYLKKYSITFNQPDKIRYSQILSYSIFYTVTLSVLFISFFWLKAIQEERLNETEKQLQLKAQAVSSEVANYISYHQKGLLLTVANEPTVQDPTILTSLLKNIAQTYPTILTLLATNKDGDVIAAAPEIMMEKISGKGLNVSYRPYFFKPKDSLQPFVSDVFQGRNFGEDPIIAISVPLIDMNKFIGIIEASLDLKLLTSLDSKSISEEEGLLILDEHNKVIYHSLNLQYKFLQDLSDNPLIGYLQNKNKYYFHDQGEYLILESAAVESMGWKIIATVPRNVYETTILNYMFKLLLLLGLFVFISYLISRRITSTMSEPINQLSNELSTVEKQADFEKFSVQIEHNNIIEFQEMQDKLNEFASRLRTTVAALKGANQKKKKYNKELKHINNNLENIVASQTKELKDALKIAHEASKTKDEFLATMSHEIRTPLNGIYGMLELMTQAEDINEIKEYIKVAQSSSDALLDLINSILDFSKINAGKLKLESIDFNLFNLLDEIAAIQKLDANLKGLTVTLDADSLKNHYFRGDPGRIRQVFMNLINNAIKFTEQGEIILHAKLESSDKSSCQISAYVKDTGIGIPIDKQDSLFQTFIQADSSTTRKYGGTGLGLAICKQLIDLMNGSISIKSKEGKGSKFYLSFKLDISDNDTEVQIPESKNDDINWNGNANILLVEDNAVNQQIVSIMLKKLGLNVEVAVNGQMAIEKLNESVKTNRYHLVLMDCQMPVMDGYSATHSIRTGKASSNYKEIPIIALTANAMKGDKEKCIEAGMNDYLTKPINKEKLVKYLQMYLPGS